MRFKLKIIYFLIALKFAKWWYRNNLKKLQRRRFQKLKSALRKSPFYVPFSNDKSGIDSYPLINKAIFMEQFDRINTCNITLKEASAVAVKAEQERNFSPTIHGITVGLSTGTSGNRGIFLASESDRAKWVAGVLDRVIGFSLKKRKVAFFLRANSNLYESVRSKLLTFHFFDILQPVDENVKRLNVEQPTILVAQASMLCLLAEAQKNGQLSIDPQKIISVAEVLTAEDKLFISRIFKKPVHQVYQCTEGFLAATCTEGTLHFNEDFLIIEKKYIDSGKNRFHPVITDLMRTAQPVIRYELNDIISEKLNCPCGSSRMAIEQIEGRADDVLCFQDIQNETVPIFPDAFRKAIVLADETITDYAVIQQEKQGIGLYVESQNKESYMLAENALKNLFISYHVEGIAIKKIETDPHRIGEKKRRIKNETRKIS